MTRLACLGCLVFAAALAVGCSKAKPDAGTMRPVEHEGSAAAPDTSAGPYASDAGPAVEMPPQAWPAEENPPQVGSAPPWDAQFAPQAAPSFAPAEDSPDVTSFPMAAVPDEVPRDGDLPDGAPLAPSNSGSDDAPSSAIAPRIGARAAAPDASPDEPNYHVVDVYYGTDRARLPAVPPDMRDYVRHYRIAAGAAAMTLVLAGGLVLASQRRLAAAIGIGGVFAGAALGLSATTKVVRSRLAAASERIEYGDGRGELEMGVCRVSIPKDHRVGAIESPSVLRLEFHEDPERHVTILDAQAYSTDRFVAQMRQTLAEARRNELLVFVHGYNVAFDSAVLRTAQIAYDLKFPGAAVCYSWPSHGGLLQYAADETNVEWTAPHMKKFLAQLREESGADAINVVAHSMGTRAVTNVLREFARESATDGGAAFNHIVLAAPDIDAEVFRRDLAPAMAQLARRVTLYASSNDQALMASRTLHAYPRAGESGANLVVAPGIDTIDVSAIDTSLIGHSYYGDNDSIIADLFHLVHDALPPQSRQRLKAATQAGHPYWVFLPAASQASLPRAPQ